MARRASTPTSRSRTSRSSCRWALLKNPQPNRQPAHHPRIDRQGQRRALTRAYPAQRATPGDLRLPRPSEGPGVAGRLDHLAQRCRLDPFINLAKTIKRYRQLILGRRRTRPAGRPLRGHQHPPAAAHPPRLPGYRDPEGLITMADSPAAVSAHHSPDDHENRPQERQ